MFLNKKLFLTILTVGVILGVVSIWASKPDQFEFIEATEVKGFRSLVLGEQSSSFDPVLGALPRHEPEDSESSALDICAALSRADWGTTSGSPDAEITIVEFSDYRCPYCRTLAGILQQLQTSQNVRIIHKEWPILGKSSELSARAALAAARQGAYKEVRKKLLQTRFIPNVAYVKELAAKFELDQTRFVADMQSEDIRKTLERNQMLARTLGLVGTPALVVGRTIVQGAITRNQLERLIELERPLPPIC